MGGDVESGGGDLGVGSIKGIGIAWLRDSSYTVGGLKDTWSMLQWVVSRGIQSYLEPGGAEEVEGVIGDVEVSQALQESSGDVLETSEEANSGGLMVISKALE